VKSAAARFFRKLKGQGETRPPRESMATMVLAALGCFIAIGTVLTLSSALSVVLLLGSFGASCVLAFGFPDSPFAQPRNIVGGHFVSCLVGLGFVAVFGAQPWVAAAAVAAAITLMMWLDVVHPPAGSNPLLVYLLQPGWGFAFFPTLAGAVLIVCVALVYNNLVREANYPSYW
jgi:CBS-domain-containing membrane protein